MEKQLLAGGNAAVLTLATLCLAEACWATLRRCCCRPRARKPCEPQRRWASALAALAGIAPMILLAVTGDAQRARAGVLLSCLAMHPVAHRPERLVAIGVARAATVGQLRLATVGAVVASLGSMRCADARLYFCVLGAMAYSSL